HNQHVQNLNCAHDDEASLLVNKIGAVILPPISASRLAMNSRRRGEWMGSLFICAWMVGSHFSGAAQPEFDLVIRNGRLADGTANPSFHGDLAITGDRIASVGRALGAGSREIDARGLVVAPGFIDIHSHSDWLLLEDGSAPSKIRQGVTTEVLGEGGSAGPSKGKLVARPVS